MNDATIFNVRSTLPFLIQLSAKVARVHGDHDPRLRELNEAFLELCEELDYDEEPQPDVRPSLRRLRELSDGFVPPEWACTSYRRLLTELQSLESSVLQP